MKKLLGIAFTLIYAAACDAPASTLSQSTPVTATVNADTLKKEVVKIKDTLSGDFNGDGRQEKAWYEKAALATNPESDASCIDKDCPSAIKFSDASIAAIPIHGTPYGSIQKLGDLDEDNAEEIGLFKNGFHSCWSSYEVWSLKRHTWKQAVETLSYYACNENNDEPVVKKDPAKKGYVLAKHFDESGAHMTLQSVKLK